MNKLAVYHLFIIFIFCISFIGNSKAQSLTENDLVEVTSRIQRVYKNFVETNYKSKIIFNLNWSDETVSAFATRPVEGEFHITIAGGMAKAKGMTKNSLALVVCHELGHHLAGAPHTKLYNGWPSAEGQADYWATSKCLKKYFQDLSHEDVEINSNIPEKVIADCNQIYGNMNDLKICVKTILASIDFGNFLNNLPSTRVPINLETPDTRVVRGTNINDYPKAQCRFDTLYQGALCSISSDAMTSDTDPNKNSCIDYTQLGARPRCWFKP